MAQFENGSFAYLIALRLTGQSRYYSGYYILEDHSEYA